MRRKKLVRFVARLARAFDTRPADSAEDHAPIDPALLPIDLAAHPMAFH